MTDQAIDPKEYKAENYANPTVHEPTMANQWFIEPPGPDKEKYKARPGNAVKLLNCGEAYLPVLKDAIEKAEESIYIAIWGFDEELSLTLQEPDEKTKPKNTISKILEDKAAGKNGKKPVEVKILVWFNAFSNVITSEPTLHENAWYNPSLTWSQKAMKGDIPNLQFVTRDPDNFGSSPKSQERIKQLESDREKEQSQITGPGLAVRNPTDENFENQKKLDAIDKINQRIKLVRKAGANTDELQQKRIQNGHPTASMGKIPTHHQKIILIDHRNSQIANCFVQGFNLKPFYFDCADHPFRNPQPHFQDVGLHLRGPCLLDLFYNFQESWNKAVDANPYVWKERGKCNLINEAPPRIESITGTQTYNAQILRTWPLNDEKSIYEFIKKAISQLNEFIYIEDQYFRMPEFADAINDRAKQIRDSCGRQKKLYVFVITSLNEDAFGEVKLREDMIHTLGRDDVNANKEEFDIRQSEKLKKETLDKMQAKGVMVQFCQLMTSKKEMQWSRMGSYEVTRYQNIYVHAKISFFDNAFVLIGSANWNLRSMAQDSELDIAVKCHDDIGKGFREYLWTCHLNCLWQAMDTMGNPTTPEDWYVSWQNLLSQNWVAYRNKLPLIMNLFPYYENLKQLRFKGPINTVTQGTG